MAMRVIFLGSWFPGNWAAGGGLRLYELKANELRVKVDWDCVRRYLGEHYGVSEEAAHYKTHKQHSFGMFASVALQVVRNIS